ncbi:hypothetical protein EDB19DRAFT_1836166 [Suillus lakei]|nr:hypothetical protein EDB19DRAFT_1836166 [Suillus lakei]
MRFSFILAVVAALIVSISASDVASGADSEDCHFFCVYSSDCRGCAFAKQCLVVVWYGAPHTTALAKVRQQAVQGEWSIAMLARDQGLNQFQHCQIRRDYNPTEVEARKPAEQAFSANLVAGTCLPWQSAGHKTHLHRLHE